MPGGTSGVGSSSGSGGIGAPSWSSWGCSGSSDEPRRKKRNGTSGSAGLAGHDRAGPGPAGVGDGLRLIEAEADHAADRVVADGHAVERVGGLDRAAVVGDDDELRLVGELPE